MLSRATAIEPSTGTAQQQLYPNRAEELAKCADFLRGFSRGEGADLVRPYIEALVSRNDDFLLYLNGFKYHFWMLGSYC
jgi:hypothetical protein